MAAITIQLDAEVHARAQELAMARQMTIEQLAARLLRMATERVRSEESAPVTRSAVGILRGLPDRPFQELVEEALLGKYGPLR